MSWFHVRRSRGMFALMACVASSAGCSLMMSFDGLTGGVPGTARDGDTGGARDDAATDSNAPTSSRYAEVVREDEPKAYYRLGDTSAGAKDEMDGPTGVIRGNVPNVAGALVEDGDRAARFDGASYIDLGDQLALLGKSAFTLEAWVNPDDMATTERCVLAKNDASGSDGYAFYLYDDRAQLRRYASGGEWAASDDRFEPGRFTHLVVTYEGGTITIYIDGKVSATESTSNSVGQVSTPLTLGASRGGSSCHFLGAIDEVAIYDHALGRDRVELHHDTGLSLRR